MCRSRASLPWHHPRAVLRWPGNFLHFLWLVLIVLVGGLDDPETEVLLAQIHHRYVPNKTVVVTEPDARECLPLARGKTRLGDQVTVYVCHDHACSPPVTGWEALEPLLGAAPS